MDHEKLYRTYYMDVFSYAMTIMKNSAQAEEITQDVFFRAMNSKKQFEGRSSELTWLCAIAKNACMDELCRQNRSVPLEDDIESEESFSEKLEDKDTLLRIHRLLHAMEEPYKEVFQLRVFGELPFADIAKIFAKTESWARVTYHRARLKLQERIREYE